MPIKIVIQIKFITNSTVFIRVLLSCYYWYVGDNMLTALSVASESLIVEPQDKILMASVSWMNGEPKPSLVWCPIENNANEKLMDSLSNNNNVPYILFEKIVKKIVVVIY